MSEEKINSEDVFKREFKLCEDFEIFVTLKVWMM